MNIFDYSNYRKFVLDWVRARPRNGHGQFRQMAIFCDMSTVNVSQIFNGERQLQEDQAHKLAEYLGLSETETRYLILLVHQDRAKTSKYKTFIEKQLQELRANSLDLKQRLAKTDTLPDAAKAVFYSSWHYSAVRLATSIEGLQDVDAIAKRLKLPRTRVLEVMEFLLEQGLCANVQGRLRLGPAVTHLEKKSRHIKTHQTEWRLKSIQRLEARREQDLFYSGLMSLSQETFDSLKKQFVEMIDAAIKEVTPSPAQQLVCLNLDWFRIDDE